MRNLNKPSPEAAVQNISIKKTDSKFDNNHSKITKQGQGSDTNNAALQQ